MNKTTQKFGPVETDAELDRKYIPLPGGWEVQTKGKGSTFRICGPDGHRMVVPEYIFFHDFVESMARDVNKVHDEVHACAMMLRNALVSLVGTDDLQELEDMLQALPIVQPHAPAEELQRVTNAILAIQSSRDICNV